MDDTKKAKELKSRFFTECLPNYQQIKRNESYESSVKKILNVLYYFQSDWVFCSSYDFWLKFEGKNNVINTLKFTLFEHPYPDWRIKAIIYKMVEKDGYSGGCGCGCRGDLCITDKGLDLIGKQRVLEYEGY